MNVPSDETEPAASLTIWGDHLDVDECLDRWPELKGAASESYRKGDPIPESDELCKANGFHVNLLVEGEVWEQLDLLRVFILQHHDALAWLRDYQPVFLSARLTMNLGTDAAVLELPAPVLGLLAGLGIKLEILPRTFPCEPAAGGPEKK